MKKLYIAETYKEFDQWCRDNKEPSGNKFVVTTNNQDNRQKLLGLELSGEDFLVIGDPKASWSFWVTLQSRIGK